MHFLVIVLSTLLCQTFLTSTAIPVPSDTVGQLLASRNVTTSSDVQRRDTSVYGTTQPFPRHDSEVPAEDYFLGAKGVTNILDALNPPLYYVFVGELEYALLTQQFQGPFTALTVRVSSIDLKRTERALDKEETWGDNNSFTLKRKETTIILTREGKEVQIPFHIDGVAQELHSMGIQGPPIPPLMIDTYLFPVPSISLKGEDYLLAALAVTRTLKDKNIYHGFAKELKNGSPSLTLVVSYDHRERAIDALDRGFSFSNPVNFAGFLKGSVVMLIYNGIARVNRRKYTLRIPIRVEGEKNHFGLTQEPVGPPMGSPPHIYEFSIVS